MKLPFRRVQLSNPFLAPAFRDDDGDYYIVTKDGMETYVSDYYIKNGKFQRWKYIYPWVLIVLCLGINAYLLAKL